MHPSGAPPKFQPDELFALARAGNEDAWRQLVGSCYDKVLRVVRRRLDPRIRSILDSSDIANDVFKSLVAKSGKFDFPNMAALRAHLEQSAQRKVIDEYRRHHRRCRDVALSRSLSQAHTHDPGADGPGDLDPPAHDPTASQFAQAAETRELLLGSSGDSVRPILELKVQDYSNEEVAERTGLHVRKVQRVIKRVSDAWTHRRGG